MSLLALTFTFLEIAIFSMAVFVFLLTVRFFLASQKSLEDLLPETKKKKRLRVAIDREGFIVPTGSDDNKKHYAYNRNNLPDYNEETRSEIKELRGMLELQQLELKRAMRHIEDFAGKKETRYDDDDYVDKEEGFTGASNDEMEMLQLQLEKREAELREVRQQGELNKKLQGHFEEVQSGYEELQLKVQKMEQQAWQAAELSIKVDSLEQTNEQLEKTVLRKDEKARELTIENGRLHEVLNETEDKLSEANLQRQQLLKKVQFLEEVNSDIQQMSDANRKLKNELRRVAELESMLNLITEERDTLLHRRSNQF